MKYLRRQNLNISNLFDDTILQRADGNIELNPSQRVIINGSLEFPPGAAIPGPEVTNVMYVTMDGNDDNTGYGEGPTQAKRTLKSALAAAQQGTTIYVRSGEYYEDNPLVCPPKVSIIGDNLRRTILRPLNGPLVFNVTNVERTDQLVTITTAEEHGLKPRDRIRVRANIGAPITAGSFVVGKRYKIVQLGTTDFTAIGSPYNTKGTEFTATAVGTGTGTAYLAEADETDVNILSVPSATTLVYRQSGSDIPSTPSTGRILHGIDFFYCNSQTYIAQLVFKGLRAPAYCVNIDTDAIVDTSPYVQNCSNINGPWLKNGTEWIPFVSEQPDLNGTMVTGPRPLLDSEVDPTQVDEYGIDIEGSGGGMLIDGDRYSPLSPIKSMVGDAFTQVSQGGIGFHITNFGYMQLVSCFAVFCSKAFYTTRGGYLSISNSVIDFGTQGFVADGYYLDPYSVGKIPQDYYSTLGSVTVNAEGSGFTSPPDIIVEPPDPGVIGGRQATAIASIDPITGKLNAISVVDAGYGYDFVPEITIVPANGAIATANLQKNLSITVKSLANKPQVGSIMFLGDDPTAYYISNTIGGFVSFVYDEVKCRRDADIILDGVYYDAALGTNYNAVVNGLSYRRVMASEVIDEQLDPTIGALYYLRSRAAVSLSTDSTAQNRSNLAFNEIINIVQSGPNQADPIVFPAPTGADTNKIAAKDQLVANKEFIKAEVIAYINSTYPSLAYNQATCARDIGYMVDGFCYDVLYGGNSASVTVARSYFEGAVSVLPNDQKLVTAAAIDHLSVICQQIVQEQIVTPSAGNTESQDFSGTPATIAEANLVDSLAGIISDVIAADSLGGLPALVNPSVAWVDSNTLTAVNQLATDSPNIIEMMIDYIDLNYVTPFKYDQQKCRRDIGYIVDAVLADAVFDTNHQAVYAGLAYLRSYSSKVTSLQKSQTIDAIIQAQDLTVALTTDSNLQNKIISGFTIIRDIINFGVAVVPAVSIPAPAVRDAGYAEAADILVANKGFIQDEIVAWFENNYPTFTYDSVKCSRDVGIILNAVFDDIVFDSNYRSITAGLAYIRSYASEVTENQKRQTIAGINKARDLAIALIPDRDIKDEVEAKFKLITDIIDDVNDSSVPAALTFTDSVGASDVNLAARVLQVNKKFLRAEIIAWINQQIMTNTAPFDSTFSYNSAKCSRDVGYLIDALTYDLIYGGNSQSIGAGNAYYSGAVSFIDGQETQSAAAFGRLKNIIGDIVQNNVVAPTPGNFEAQNTSLPSGSGDTANTLEGLIDIVNDIIIDGTTSTVLVSPTYSSAIYYAEKNVYRTTVLAEEANIRSAVIDYLDEAFARPYNESKCRRDIAYIIDAMAYDLTYEGNSQTVNAALAYADGTVLGREVEETQKSYQYWKSIVGQIVKNIAITPTPGNTSLQDTSKPLGSPLNSDGPARKAQALLDIVINAIDHGPGYVPDPVMKPEYANGDPLWLIERNSILESLESIQDQTIEYLNSEYGGQITIETFPPITSVLKDTEVRFHNVSTISTGATAMEYVGAGVTYNALPFFGGEPEPKNERIEINNGKCFTVTSDQIGNYRIGEFFTVNALTGEITIDAEKLNLSGLASIGPFRRNGIPVGVVLREVSNNPNLIASTGAQDGNTTPTQQAVSIYVENRYLNKVQDTTPQTVASDITFQKDVAINGGDLETNQATFNLINEVAETVNFAGEATELNIAAPTGTTTINNNLSIGGDVISAPQPTVNLVNTFTETVNFAGDATEINIGADTGTMTIKNDTVTFDNATQINVNGNNPIIASTSNGTLTLFNNNISEVNAFGDATEINIGATGSNVVFTGDIQVNGGDITTDQSTFNLINTNASTVNFAGAASDINIGSNLGTTTVNNNFEVLQNTTLGFDTDSINEIRGTITLSLKDNTTTVLNVAEATDSYIKIDTSNGTELTTFGSTPKVTFLNTTDSSSSITGAATFAGGVGIAKKLYVGDNTVVDGSTTLGNERTLDTHTVTGATSINVPDDTATAFEVKENTQSYIKAVTTNGAETVTIGSTPKLIVSNTTDSTTKDSGALVVEGGVGIEKNLTVGVDLTVERDVFVKDDVDVDGDVNIDGGNLTTGATTFNLLDTTATTVNAFGAATTIDIGASSGTLTVNNAGTVFNSTSYVKIPVGTVAQRPSPEAAGMIRYNSELSTFEGFGPGGNWGSLGGVKDVDGNTYIIPETAPGANENILYFYNDGTNTAQMKETVFELYHGTTSTSTTSGSLVVTGGVGISENVYIGGIINVANNGTIGGTLDVTGNTTLTADLAVNGGDLTTTAGTFNLVNGTATVVNFAGNATDIQIGAATGTTNINHNLDVDGDINIDGGDLTASTTTFNLLSTNVTTLNLADLAQSVNIADEAVAASTLSFGPAISGNTVKVSGTATGTVNYTTDVTLGTVNAWQSVTGTINIGANGAINLGTNGSAVTTVTVGSTITGNTLKIAGTAGGTINLTTDVTTGTVNAFNSVTTGGTVNLATGSEVTVNIGGVDSVVNVKELTLVTDLEVQYGGTGQSTFTENGIIYGNNANGLLVTAESNPGSNATTSYGILTTDINNVPVWTDTIDGGSY